MNASRQPVSLEGHVVIVTGGGRALGRAHALLAAQLGAHVVVADHGGAVDGGDANDGGDPSIAEAVAGEIEAAGGTAMAFCGDLSCETQATGVVLHALQRFGRVDAIVHNAGIAAPATAQVGFSTNQYRKMMAINADALFWLSRAAWPTMEAQGFGRIVATTSAAIYGEDLYLPYSMAKSALIGFVRTLASEGRRSGIRVNAVSPWAYSRMAEATLPEGAFREFFRTRFPPGNVSPLVVYLCSPECAVTGEIFSAGGDFISRVLIGETTGIRNVNGSAEMVRDAIGDILAQTGLLFPASAGEIAGRVMDAHGFGEAVQIHR